ncbi:hypothetical protein BASA81_010369 [Batrachochytrium salamandrivorans]|nr:hypothetical protein BASA81_010369 [Batrachochytrium salamandrivorans]
MPDEEEEDEKVELPSKRPHVEGDAAAAAPKSDAILAIETSIAKLALEVDALKDELKVAKAEVAKWSGRKFNSLPGTDTSQADAALDFYTGQVIAAQTALDKEKDRLDKANAQLLEEKRFLDNEKQRQHEREKLQLGGAKLAVPVPISEVVDEELAKVTWPLQKDVKLLPPTFFEDYMHVRNAKFVAAPSKPDQPSMLFHRLGDKKFVTGKRLIDFHATRDKQKCTVLLAPSGAGKTRNLFELLNEVLGFFIPYKLDNDKNYGSEALSAVLKLLQADPTMSWESTPPNYQANDKRAKFAIYCVLIAFTEVYRGLEKSFKAPPTPSQWLLIQLFPTQFLNEDVFAKLATSLYEHCDPRGGPRVRVLSQRLLLCH